MLPQQVPADRLSRWAMASKIIEDWFGNTPAMEPATAAGIAAAEQRLGLALPTALREWYLELGSSREVWSVQDQLVLIDELCIEGDRLILFRENQGVVQWGIQSSSLHLPDPPVTVSDPSDPGVRHIAAQSVSEFALQMLALNAKFASHPLPRANGQIIDDAIVAFEERFQRLPIPNLHWPPFPTRFYGDENLVIEIQADTWIWITALDSNAFAIATRLATDFGVQLEMPVHGLRKS
jgi:hypothetical protein